MDFGALLLEGQEKKLWKQHHGGTLRVHTVLCALKCQLILSLVKGCPLSLREPTDPAAHTQDHWGPRRR